MKIKRILKDVLNTVLFAVLLTLMANCVIVNAKIPTGSMEQTIMTGDRIIGSRLAYKITKPKRGDIAMFRYPEDESRIYIKRIIGMPGDTVELKDGILYINGNEYKEDYLGSVDYRNYGPYNVPENSYFMLGDNRTNSHDSRFWSKTYVEKDKIIARAVFRYWPLPTAKLIG